MKRLLTAAVMLSALAALPPRSLAWGSKGHQIIAGVASERLSSRARRGVSDLLGKTSLEEASTWAETPQAKRRTVDFVLIPLEANDYNPGRDCQKDCLIQAAQHYMKVLGDYGRPQAERAEALRYVIHLVGDLHQPLHCADNNDAGGNRKVVTFFGQVTNLHKVWDDGLISRENTTAAKYAQDLSASKDRSQFGNSYTAGTVVDWALESHRVARRAYEMSGSGNLGNEYYRAAQPLADEQLYKAGVRLARVLNDTFR